MDVAQAAPIEQQQEAAIATTPAAPAPSASDRARAAESGFDRYLVKPFSMQDVRDALDVAQQRRAGTRDIAGITAAR